MTSKIADFLQQRCDLRTDQRFLNEVPSCNFKDIDYGTIDTYTAMNDSSDIVSKLQLEIKELKGKCQELKLKVQKMNATYVSTEI